MRTKTLLALAPPGSPIRKRPRDVANTVKSIAAPLGVQLTMSATVKRKVAKAWNDGIDLQGHHPVSFLPAFNDCVYHADPKATISMSLGEDNTFQHWFVSPSWMEQLMQWCLPVLQLDGAHLYNNEGLHLYLAVVQDAGRHPMVIGYGIAGNESTATWGAFLSHLQLAYGSVFVERRWTVMSDQGLGLISALSDSVFWRAIPSARCVLHLKRNYAQRGKKGGATHWCYWTKPKQTQGGLFIAGAQGQPS